MFSLNLLHVYKKFEQANNTIVVLDNVCATFSIGKTYAIMGRSGSGKSTLIHLLAGIELPDSGIITFDKDEHIQDTYNNILLHKTIGLIFQNAYLIKELSVIENVMLPGLINGQSYQACLTKGRDLLKSVELDAVAMAKPKSLSGGQQQRLSLARALFNEPSFLLADELTGNLDTTTAHNIMNLLHTVQQRWGMGLIISTHDQTIANTMNATWYLNNGLLHMHS